jgi:hypothetical protein
MTPSTMQKQVREGLPITPADKEIPVEGKAHFNRSAQRITVYKGQTGRDRLDPKDKKTHCG